MANVLVCVPAFFWHPSKSSPLRPLFTECQRKAPAQYVLNQFQQKFQAGKLLQQRVITVLCLASEVTTASTSDAYQANSEQQAAIGIATAINSKVCIWEKFPRASRHKSSVTGVNCRCLQNGVTDTEAQEMEKWLAAQGQTGEQYAVQCSYINLLHRFLYILSTLVLLKTVN